jgi:hypothetical protein
VAEGALLGLRAQAACGACGRSLSVDSAAPAAFCRDCGSCLLRVPGWTALQPCVPPRIGGGAAWLKLRAALLEPGTADMTAARLLFVPFHEWPADLGRTRLVRDARAVLAPAADLLPAGLAVPRSPRGDDRRALAVAASAHKGRLADPADLMDLIKMSEAVDVMIPAPAAPPPGAAPGSAPRLLYYPFWFLTYRIEWKENRGVVDAATGRPVGASAPPSRWAPAILAAAAGLAAFAAVASAAPWLAGAAAGAGAGAEPGSTAALSVSGVAYVLATAAVSWAAAFLVLSRLLRRERAR